MLSNGAPEGTAPAQRGEIGELIKCESATAYPGRRVELNTGVEGGKCGGPGKAGGESGRASHREVAPHRHQRERARIEERGCAQQTLDAQSPLQARQNRSAEHRTRSEKSQQDAVACGPAPQVLARKERHQAPKGARPEHEQRRCGPALSGWRERGPRSAIRPSWLPPRAPPAARFCVACGASGRTPR